MIKTFWGVASAAVEQSRRKANYVVQGDGNSPLEIQESLQTQKRPLEIIQRFDLHRKSR